MMAIRSTLHGEPWYGLRSMYRLDRYLLYNYPVIWASRMLWHIPGALLTLGFALVVRAYAALRYPPYTANEIVSLLRAGKEVESGRPIQIPYEKSLEEFLAQPLVELTLDISPGWPLALFCLLLMLIRTDFWSTEELHRAPEDHFQNAICFVLALVWSAIVCFMPTMFADNLGPLLLPYLAFNLATTLWLTSALFLSRRFMSEFFYTVSLASLGMAAMSVVCFVPLVLWAAFAGQRPYFLPALVGGGLGAAILAGPRLKEPSVRQHSKLILAF